MKIAIGNDHAAVEMKQEIKKYLEELGHEVVNYGTDSNDSCDYPVYGEKVGKAVAADLWYRCWNLHRCQQGKRRACGGVLGCDDRASGQGA